MGCQKANGVPKSKWGAKRQMGCQKANGAPKGKWGTKRQMRCQKANGAPKGKWGGANKQNFAAVLDTGKAMYPRNGNEASQIGCDLMKAMRPIRMAMNQW
jgi:hypothetical protein